MSAIGSPVGCPVGSPIGMEIRKLKRRRYWLMAAGAAGLEVAWLAAATAKRAGGPVEMRLMALTLNEALAMCSLALPIIAALLASRLATVDTEERMGQLFTALGQREGARFGAKLVLGSLSVMLGQLALIAFTAVAGPGMGLEPTADYQEAIWPIAVVMASASVAAAAVQLALATCVEKQAVGLGVGMLAGLVCSGLAPARLEALGWALPWGITTAASPISSVTAIRSGAHFTVDHPWVNAMLAVVAAMIWSLLARLAIAYKENHR